MGAGDGRRVGISHETAVAFACEGADIVAVDLDEARLAEASRLVELAGRRCLACGCDVSDAAVAEALATRVAEAIGAPDVVVNNAGIGFPSPFLDTPVSAWAANPA